MHHGLTARSFLIELSLMCHLLPTALVKKVIKLVASVHLFVSILNFGSLLTFDLDFLQVYGS